jgi:hypothetical protein
MYYILSISIIMVDSSTEFHALRSPAQPSMGRIRNLQRPE